MEWKNFIKSTYQKPHFWRRMVMCFVAVCIMGSCTSWLKYIALGSDPCSVMNFGISKQLGLSFGNWQAILNIALFFIVLWKDKYQIGFGTIFNMFMVGYSCDFMTWLRETFWSTVVFDVLWIKLVVTFLLLALFVCVAAVYMSVELGTAPYDAIPIIIGNSQNRVSFRVVRICWDCVAMVIGYFAGGTIGIVTIIMAFTIGPMAAMVGKYIRPLID